MYKICYVDEEMRDINLFDTAMDGIFHVTPIEVTSEHTLDSLIEQIFSVQPDCLIVDYNLRQKTGNHFMGDEVLKLFNRTVGHFPQMLLTNHDQEAIRVVDGLDVDTIRGKYEYVDRRDVFIERISKMIETHKNKATQARETLEKLSKKIDGHESLTLAEEEAYLAADNFLEEQLLPDQAKTPGTLKKISISNDDRLLELISETEQLVAELRKHETV